MTREGERTMFTTTTMVFRRATMGTAILSIPLLMITRAQAQDTIPAVTTPAPAPTTAPPAIPPAPYSLPWQLRPTAAASAVRSDTSVATYESGGNRGTTVASILLASYK